MNDFVIQIFTYLAKAIPKPTTELIYTSPFEFLIAVILSARTTDRIVNRTTPQLFKVANTPEKIAALGEEQLQRLIHSTGFYRAKAANILATCQILQKQFNNQVPQSFHDLVKLPGVGRKTANVILNTLFQQPTIPVDTHVFRVAHRLQLTQATTVLQTELDLLKIVPPEFGKIAGNLLLLHGRYTCTALKPNCANCVLQKICPTLAK